MRAPIRWSSFLLGLAAGAAVWWAAQELPYLNWRPIVVPLANTPLVIREDAKGNGRFGAPRSGNRSHQGVDLLAPVGAPVRAIRSGRVFVSSAHRGLGRYVELEHSGGLRSLYAHLDETGVKAGERIRQGQVIGSVGKTGNARHPLIQPHLHLEILREGQPVDPASLGLVFVESTAPTEHPDARGGQ